MSFLIRFPHPSWKPLSFEPFSSLAEDYDRWYREKREIYEKELECLKSSVKGHKLLEIGGGTGAFSAPLGAVDLDPAPGALRVAKRKGVETVLGVAEALPFRSDSFDASFFVTSLCFIGNPQRALEEAFRVSKRVVACIIPKESDLAKKYEERGKRGHKIYKYAKFLSRKLFEGWSSCDMGWFACFWK